MSDLPQGWKIVEQCARLACGPLVGRVELKSVGIHFQAERWNGTPIDSFQVLFTRGPSAETLCLVLDDWHVRGNDLVATFQKLPPDQIAPEISWRASLLRESSAVKLEMMLSVRTDLLDSAPLVTVNSFHRGGQLLTSHSLARPDFQTDGQDGDSNEIAVDRDSNEHLFLLRDQQRGVSYAQMTHPSDFYSAGIDHDSISGLWHVRESLFPERLEKGVIRRGRICGWFLPVKNDEAAAVELAKQFIAEPLPLTA